jgi:transposase
MTSFTLTSNTAVDLVGFDATAEVARLMCSQRCPRVAQLLGQQWFCLQVLTTSARPVGQSETAEAFNFITSMAPRNRTGAPPMDLANMRRQGVRNLIAYCLNDACRHQAIIDVSSYPPETPVPWFRSKVKCAKCGGRGNRIDVRPNWKEAPGSIDDWSGRPAWSE